ncbi:HNH endonuclease [candidate division KSB1 bacterium]|nr:HNH endonuclease [candidate division KSB1 bacterium]
MNFRLNAHYSVILMSLRANAPYSDRILDSGRILLYEGHDIPRLKDGPSPKSVDQPELTPSGGLTQNGLFHKAAQDFKSGKREAELVRVYEKIRAGIWTDNGLFRLTDSRREKSGGRSVFKFELELAEDAVLGNQHETVDLDHVRLIPSRVKAEVWKRDKGQCVTCGATDNLHFDHIIPFSKGGSSRSASNVQLLCERHNIAKRDKIE